VRRSIAWLASTKLAPHLRSGIHTRSMCTYEPDPADDLTWVLD
jgi:hypothetical protein